MGHFRGQARALGSWREESSPGWGSVHSLSPLGAPQPWAQTGPRPWFLPSPRLLSNGHTWVTDHKEPTNQGCDVCPEGNTWLGLGVLGAGLWEGVCPQFQQSGSCDLDPLFPPSVECPSFPSPPAALKLRQEWALKAA